MTIPRLLWISIPDKNPLVNSYPMKHEKFTASAHSHLATQFELCLSQTLGHQAKVHTNSQFSASFLSQSSTLTQGLY